MLSRKPSTVGEFVSHVLEKTNNHFGERLVGAYKLTLMQPCGQDYWQQLSKEALTSERVGCFVQSMVHEIELKCARGRLPYATHAAGVAFLREIVERAQELGIVSRDSAILDSAMKRLKQVA